MVARNRTDKSSLPAVAHFLPVSEVVSELETDPAQGLTTEEARRRLDLDGPNRLQRAQTRSRLRIVLDQLQETMVVILVLAAVISSVLGDLKDTVVIMAIVVLNTILGFLQEYRAEKATEALRQLAVPKVRVIRDDRVKQIEAPELVVGDIFLLEEGVRVAADGRLVDVANLRVEEASLTGESVPVEKFAEPLSEKSVALGDRRNMVYLGTSAVRGRGRAVVVATGMRTELGKIAQLLETMEREETVLQRRMGQLGKRLAAVALLLVIVIFGLGLWRGGGVTEMLLTAITLAVAAVPEGLPAVVTIALALGARRMVRRNALIRRLPAVETLGSVTTICSDKTGTLTENRMRVETVALPNGRWEVSELDRRLEDDSRLLLLGLALCNDAHFQSKDGGSGDAEAVGDPTETALVMAAARFDVDKREAEARLPRVGEIPFSSERKRMSTLHRSEEPWNQRGPYLLFCKGAVDCLLELADRQFIEGRVVELDSESRKRLRELNEELASEGKRVIGLCCEWLDEVPDSLGEEVERKLIFVGMAGMIDPPRDEVPVAVRKASKAGIRTIMVTGDHRLTALAIGSQVGICQPGDQAVTGTELETWSDEELGERLGGTAVFARVNPEQKLRIVTSLQKRGEVTAVTGDGVNDAPALKKADIGIAMGITGTDVSREAADAILLDDNYATIVSAVEEGRVIYDNIRKFVRYLLTTNLGEIFTMLFGLLAGLPLPLLPLQILWINLITDGLPALALSVEPAEPDTMSRRPHSPNESIFARGLWQHVLLVGLLMGLLTFSVQFFSVSRGSESWQTLVFTSLAVAQMAHVLAVRSETESLFKLGLFSNNWMFWAVSSTLFLQALVVYVPFFQRLFVTRPLSLRELGVCLGVALIVFSAVETEKWIRRRRRTREVRPEGGPLTVSRSDD